MNVATKKTELIDWIFSIEDQTIIEQIDNFRKQQKSFDFKKEPKTTITSAELKKRTTAFIESLEWKK